MDAELLAQRALNVSRVGLLLRRADPLTPEEEAALEALVRQREARVPLQHLLGEVEWGGVTLRVTPQALVPRPETEALLELTLELISGTDRPVVLDVGTGTGALALGMRHARPDAHVTATDISEDALSLARQNATRLNLNVTFLRGDLLAGAAGPFDLIVSNPPYLPDADAHAAQPEVRHDPALALYGGPDGLDVARRLTFAARGALAPGGALALELDPRNVDALAAELTGGGWTVQVHADLTGRDRFLTARPRRT